MELHGISPVSGARAPVPRPLEEASMVPEIQRDETTLPTNSRLPAASILDLGTGVEPVVYAEYTGNSSLNRVSIKIVDPITGGVIRELPYDDVLEFSLAAESYAELGRRHRAAIPSGLGSS